MAAHDLEKTQIASVLAFTQHSPITHTHENRRTHNVPVTDHIPELDVRSSAMQLKKAADANSPNTGMDRTSTSSLVKGRMINSHDSPM